MNDSVRRGKAIYGCDPLLFRQLRERRGWTQATLAEKSGYSLRLISKMESGESVSPQALEDVAEALSLPNQGVALEDLISNPVGLAKQYFAAMYTQQANMFEAIKHFLDDNVVLKIPGDPSFIPFAGIYHGTDGFKDLCQKFFACLEVPAGHNHLPHYSYAMNGTDVIVWGKSFIHPKGQPFNEPMSLCNFMKFSRGKLILLEDSFDTHRASSLFVKVD